MNTTNSTEFIPEWTLKGISRKEWKRRRNMTLAAANRAKQRTVFVSNSRHNADFFTGRSAADTARLGLRGARDRHACARNYRDWAGREEAGTARKTGASTPTE